MRLVASLSWRLGCALNRAFTHCDDLAASPGVNDTMLKLLDEGVCYSFSVIGNGFGFQDLRDRVTSGQTSTHVSFWVHLNLSEGLPAAAPEHVPLLLNSKGQLHWSFMQVFRQLVLSSRSRRQLLLKQIEIEWRAQIDRVLSLTDQETIHVVGVDGHQHVHVIPPLFRLASRLTIATQRKYVRVPYEALYFAKFSDVLTLAWWIGLTKSVVLRICLRFCKSAQRSHQFVGVIYSGKMTQLAAKRGVDASIRNSYDSLPILVLFHPCACLPDETSLWEGTNLGAWYADSWRHTEAEEIRRFHNL